MQSYSFSALKAIVFCMLRAVLDRIYIWKNGSPPPGSLEAEVGTIGHLAMQAMFGVIKEGKEKGVAEDLVRKNIRVKLGEVCAKFEHKKAGEKAFEIIEKFFERMPSVLDFNTDGSAEIKVAVDAAWASTGWDNPAARFRLVADRVVRYADGGVMVEDYKTGIVDVDWTQTKLYAFVFMHLDSSIKYVVMRLTFLARNWSVDERISREDVAWVPDFLAAQMKSADSITDVAKANKDTEDVDSIVKLGVRATANRYCGSCYHIARCPITKQALAIFSNSDAAMPVIADRESAEDYFRYVRHLEMAKKSYTERLKDWVEQNGPVVLEDEGKEFKIVESESWTGNAQALIGAFVLGGTKKGIGRADIMSGIFPALRISKDDALALGAALGVEEEVVLKFGSSKPGQRLSTVNAYVPPKTFGELIKRIREEIKPKVNQREVSEEVFGKKMALSGIELGKAPPPEKELILKLADRYKVNEETRAKMLEMAAAWNQGEGGGDGSDGAAHPETTDGDVDEADSNTAGAVAGASPSDGAVVQPAQAEGAPAGSNGNGTGTHQPGPVAGNAPVASVEERLGVQSKADEPVGAGADEVVRDPVRFGPSVSAEDRGLDYVPPELVEDRDEGRYKGIEFQKVAASVDAMLTDFKKRGIFIEPVYQFCNRLLMRAVQEQKMELLVSLDDAAGWFALIRNIVKNGEKSGWMTPAEVVKIKTRVKASFEAMDVKTLKIVYHDLKDSLAKVNASEVF